MTEAQAATNPAQIPVSESTALVPVAERAALALGSTATESHLIELATKHAAIAVVKDKAGRDQAHGAAMELKRARTQIEKVSKDARDDATKFSKAVIAEEKRLVAIIELEEERLFKIRDEWDREQERIRHAAAEAERARVDALRARIQAITEFADNAVGGKSSLIALMISTVETQVVDESYEEFQPHAENAKAETLQRLRTLHTAAAAQEAEAVRVAEEQARLIAERAELDRQRQELEEAKARAAAEAAVSAQRMIDEANVKARREAAEREAFMKQQQDAFEAEKRAAEDILATQRRELAEQRARIAAQVKAQQELEAVAIRERETAARIAKGEEELRLAGEVMDAVADWLECDFDKAEDRIVRAAAVITARRNQLETA